MSNVFTMRRRVEFCETDAAGIAHFSAFFQYMEQAEHALLRHVGLSVVMDDPEGHTISWPRVKAECEYEGAVEFEDVLDIEVRITKLGTRSITYDIQFTKDGHEIARGTMTSVCCRLEHNQPPRAIDIPTWISTPLSDYAP